MLELDEFRLIITMTTYRLTPYAKTILDAYAAAWPNATMQEIGERFGITRQRVSQVLLRAGIYVGKTAAKERTMVRGQRYCRCGRRKYYKARTCAQCVPSAPRITLSCNWCGMPVRRLVSAVEKNRRKTHKTETVVYCNHTCMGQWLAANYGFAVRHNHDAVWQLHLDTGWGATRLSRQMGIPPRTVSYILKKMRRAITLLRY